MPTTITVMYPNVTDASFDLDYYMKTHMPLVGEKFTPHGLTGWRVLKIIGSPTNDPVPYSVIATLEFGAPEQFQAAVAAEGGPVMGDIPNFTNTQPVILVGDVVGVA